MKVLFHYIFLTNTTIILASLTSLPLFQHHLIHCTLVNGFHLPLLEYVDCSAMAVLMTYNPTIHPVFPSLRVTQYDMLRLSKLDGLGTWREQEAADLSSLVQKRLHNLQNPPDCSKAKKLVCNLNKV